MNTLQLTALDARNSQQLFKVVHKVIVEKITSAMRVVVIPKVLRVSCMR